MASLVHVYHMAKEPALWMTDASIQNNTPSIMRRTSSALSKFLNLKKKEKGPKYKFHTKAWQPEETEFVRRKFSRVPNCTWSALEEIMRTEFPEHRPYTENGIRLAYERSLSLDLKTVARTVPLKQPPAVTFSLFPDHYHPAKFGADWKEHVWTGAEVMALYYLAFEGPKLPSPSMMALDLHFLFRGPNSRFDEASVVTQLGRQPTVLHPRPQTLAEVVSVVEFISPNPIGERDRTVDILETYDTLREARGSRYSLAALRAVSLEKGYNDPGYRRLWLRCPMEVHEDDEPLHVRWP
ncbi:MAG: hypothetical protein M1814_002365 [Vezdaea aestivalis]|nr:MAG: hypothetical protein M1814_002365 [Vezdaea aestivalis]